MLKISEFSRMGMVTVKALRYYDEIGLLPPAHVDEWTKYRYYSAEQLPILRRIGQIQGMGFEGEAENYAKAVTEVQFFVEKVWRDSRMVW